MNKRTLVTLGVAGVTVLGSGAFAVANAATSTSTGTSLAQKIASTFHLDASKVQAVIDQDRASHDANREADYQSRLTQAVTDGKITATQKTLILAEHQKLEAEMKASTATDRRTTMDAIRTESDAWAKANNIDAKWLMGGGPGGPGGHGPDGDMPDASTSTTSPSPTPSS